MLRITNSVSMVSNVSIPQKLQFIIPLASNAPCLQMCSNATSKISKKLLIDIFHLSSLFLCRPFEIPVEP